jgi:hypothetical protein
MQLKMQGKKRQGWGRRDEGSTAVEFALLSIPFVTFVIGIIEIALLMANASILEGAANDAARMIRTGQAQQSGDAEEAFRDALCNHARIMDCNTFQYDVTTLDSFDAAGEEGPEFDEEGNMEDTIFEAGGSGDIVMIRVSYMYRLLTPLIGNVFSNYPGNRRLLMSTVVLQTEPYEFD